MSIICCHWLLNQLEKLHQLIVPFDGFTRILFSLYSPTNGGFLADVENSTFFGSILMVVHSLFFWLHSRIKYTHLRLLGTFDDPLAELWKLDIHIFPRLRDSILWSEAAKSVSWERDERKISDRKCKYICQLSRDEYLGGGSKTPKKW